MRPLANVAVLACMATFACKPTKLGDCQREPLEQLADQLAAAEPRARPDLVHAQLPTACELPDAMTRYLEHLRPVGSEVPSLDYRSHAMLIDREAFGHACAAGRRVFDVFPNLPWPERGPYLYETCKLARYQLADVEEGVSLMVYALHRWLLDQGLDAERARRISRAVWLSEARAYARAGTYADRQLPEVTRASQAFGPGPLLVHVTANAILYDEMQGEGEVEFAQIREGRIASEPSSDSDVRPLGVALASLRRTMEFVSESVEPTRIDIAADVGTRLETIAKICNSGIASQFHEFGLVVETAPWDRAVLPFELARAGESSDRRIDLDAPEQLCTGDGSQLTIELVGPPDATVAQLAASLAALRAQPCVARVLLRVA